MNLEALRLPMRTEFEIPENVLLVAGRELRPNLFLKGPIPLNWLAAAGRLNRPGFVGGSNS